MSADICLCLPYQLDLERGLCASPGLSNYGVLESPQAFADIYPRWPRFGSVIVQFQQLKLQFLGFRKIRCLSVFQDNSID